LKLTQIEVRQDEGTLAQESVRQIGVTAQTFYGWRIENFAVNRDHLQRLKALEV